MQEYDRFMLRYPQQLLKCWLDWPDMHIQNPDQAVNLSDDRPEKPVECARLGVVALTSSQPKPPFTACCIYRSSFDVFFSHLWASSLAYIQPCHHAHATVQKGQTCTAIWLDLLVVDFD